MTTTIVTMKKNVRKNFWGILMMGALLCVLPFLASCSEEETIFNFNVKAGECTDPGNEAIYEAIVSYLDGAGIINRQFSKSVDGSVDINSDEVDQILLATVGEVTDRISAVDYQAVLRDAGITVAPGHPDVTISFIVQLVDAKGNEWKNASLEYTLSFNW